MRRDGLRWCDSGELTGLEEENDIVNHLLFTGDTHPNSAGHSSPSSSLWSHVP